MRRRPWMAAALSVVLVGAALAGCAPAPVPPVDLPAVVDPAAVPGLSFERIRNDSIGIQSRVAILPAVPALVERTRAIVRREIAARADATGLRYAPAVHDRTAGLGDRACLPGSTFREASALVADPALGPPGGTGTAIVCDIAAAAGTFVAVRLRIVSADAGSVTADRVETLVADTATGDVVGAEDLWRPDAASVAVPIVRDRIGAADPAVDETALRAALSSTLVGADGSFVLPLPAPGGPLVVEVPRSRLPEVATPIGLAVADAVSGAEPFAAAPVAAGRRAVDCALVPCVAVTYDDGPSDLTPGILDDLAACDSAATFFAMGEKAAAGAATLRRIVADGDEIGSHTWSHPHLRELSVAAATAQIRDATAALEAASGAPVRLFRPPYGQYDDAIVRAAGLPTILWDVETFDWQNPLPEVAVSRAVDPATPGTIVLQHDIQQVTADTTPEMCRAFRDRGFTLVTVTQLVGADLPATAVLRRAP